MTDKLKELADYLQSMANFDVYTALEKTIKKANSLMQEQEVEDNKKEFEQEDQRYRIHRDCLLEVTIDNPSYTYPYCNTEMLDSDEDPYSLFTGDENPAELNTIEIDMLIEKLNYLKEMGADRVSIDLYLDHGDYILYGFKYTEIKK